jgi:hypothetical protein
MTGRPTLYTPEIIEEICIRLYGGESLTGICKSDHMPCMSTVMTWLVKSELGDPAYAGFLESYLRARDAQADVIFDECLTIADDSQADLGCDSHTGELKINTDTIQRAKLRIDTRMRMAGKLKPKKYGDKITQEIDAKVEVADVSAAKAKLLSGLVSLTSPIGTDQQD